MIESRGIGPIPQKGKNINYFGRINTDKKFHCLGLVLGPVGCDGAPGPLVVGVALVTVPHHELVVLGVERQALLHLLVVELVLLLQVLPGSVHRPLINLK